ncbi:phytanoyl-CoA dioxygenase family protein [Rhodobacteraceae bacterium NNCM2]|nr:phytanoyl-CoA dioxygenase family protein [Coraliihabitans acroporae]
MSLSLDLTDKDLADFARDGFLIRDRIISDDLVEMLRGEMAALFEGRYASGLIPDEVNWRPGDSAHVTRQICNGWKASPRLASVVLAPEVGRAVSFLNDWPGARIAQDNVLWKPPAGDRPGGALGMHQDSAYAGFATLPLMCTVWIALDDVTREGGSMVFARGSHRWAHHPPAEAFHDPKDYLAEFRAAGGSEADLVPVVVPKGGGSIHHGWLWHGSGPNHGQTPRRSVVAHCLSVEARFTDRLNPVYSRYKRLGSDEMDEAHFPILWHRERAPSSFIAPYAARQIPWHAAD